MPSSYNTRQQAASSLRREESEGLMNYPIIACVIAGALFTSVSTKVDQPEDEAAIRKVIDESIAAFNRHDAKALYSSSTEDTEDWRGTQKGRATLEKSIAELFEEQPNIEEKQLAEMGIILVTPDVALYKFRLEHTGMVDQTGKPLPPTQSLVAFVLVRRAGKWLKAARFTQPIEE